MENNKRYLWILYAFLFFTALCLFLAKQYIFGAVMLFAVAVCVLAEVYFFSPTSKYAYSKHKEMTEASVKICPFPTAIINADGKILWYNAPLSEMLGGALLAKKDITSFFPNFDFHALLLQIPQIIICSDKFYEIVCTKAEGESWKGSFFLYFTDVTERENIRLELKNEKTCVMVISVDNYEEVKKAASEEDAPSISGKLQKAFITMANEGNGILKRLEKEKFLYILSYKTYMDMKNKKFPIVETVKDSFKDFPMSPTLSIGVGIDGATFEENDAFASAALDMALGRGGGQVVIRNGVNFEYFGGKTKALERRSKVKARVVAHALRELISQNDRVVIMGHPKPDIDALGAAVSLAAYCLNQNTPANIVCGSSDSLVTNITGKLKEQHMWQHVFIKPENARDFVNSKTLLIVVDTHRASYVEAAELLSQTQQIAVIDHHRRGADFIDTSLLLYHEPYASSSCEMVVEMLQYMSDKQILTPLEATAVYAGIYLDTKAFSFKTGVRTLEAAAYLRRCGVDPMEVKKLFRNDFETYKIKSALMQNALIFKENMAIAKSEKDLPQSIVAQVADELVNISGIDTSFVIAPSSSHFVISARSAGNVNVQIIMEKLGGGGHMSVAGAQIETESLDDAEKELIRVIDEYISEQ